MQRVGKALSLVGFRLSDTEGGQTDGFSSRYFGYFCVQGECCSSLNILTGVKERGLGDLQHLSLGTTQKQDPL